jgi:hypothetical protein
MATLPILDLNGDVAGLRYVGGAHRDRAGICGVASGEVRTPGDP